PVAVGGYYIVTTFLQAYATTEAGVAEQTILSALTFAAFVELVATPVVSWLGDRLGAARVITAGLLAAALLAVPRALAAGCGTAAACLSLGALRLPLAAASGPIAHVLAQMSPPRVRYAGVSSSCQVAGALFGGLAPLACTALLAPTGSVYPVAGLLIAIALISIACLRKAPAHRDEPGIPAAA